MATTRVKDAGFLQQHIEKILLGVGILILLLAVLLFVVVNPFTIELSGKTYSDPQSAVEVLKRDDGMLERGLADNDPLPEIVPPKFDIEIASMINKGIDAPATLPRLAQYGLTGRAIVPIPSVMPRYATVTPPVPTNIQTKVGTDVLDPDLNPDAAAFYELWGEERNDFTMFIASGDFEIWEWADRLNNAADGATGGKIPRGIWQQRFGIAGVALLREEWDPASEQWVDRKIVEPLPGQARLLPSEQAPSEPVEAVETLTAYREAQETVTRPELPWVSTLQAGFVQIAPPGEFGAGEGTEEFDEFGRKRDLGPTEQKIQDIEERIAKIEERRRALEERQRDRNPDRDPDRNPGREREPDFSAPPSPREPSAERRDPSAQRIENLRREIERLRPRAEEERREREQRAAQEAAIEARKRAREQAIGQDRGNAFGGPGGEFAEVEGVKLEEDAKVRVYAADPTMQPGKTYRYKLLVAAINPLYAVPRLAPDQLAENKSKASLLPSEEQIEAMPWVVASTEPRMQFFFVSGSTSRGKVDVYKRVNGVMRKHSFDVAPGDMVGGVVEIDGRQIDLSTGLILVDIENRSSPLGRGDSKMIFIDKEGKLIERLSSVDSKSSVRKELDEEIEEGPEWILRPKEARPGAEEEFDGDPFLPF